MSKTKDSTFAELLYGARTRARLTQDEVLAHLGFGSKTTLLRWETGRRVPSRLQIPAIIRGVHRFDPASAAAMAANAGTTLAACGIVAVAPAAPTTAPSSATSPAAASGAARKDVVDLALLAAAEQLEIAPGRLRTAAMELFRALAAEGVTMAEAAELVGAPRRTAKGSARRA